MTVDDILNPVGLKAFLDDYFESKPLRLEGQDPSRFKALISTDSIDGLLSSQTFYSDDIDMARAEPKIQRSQFILDNGRADKGAVSRAFQEGATLILPQLHHRVKVLADYCRALEAVFSAHLQTNIYLTPGQSQGFLTHYDNHCVLILQVEGTKRWRLYDSPVGIPFRGERFTPGQFAPGKPTEEFHLNPGDVLYVPRGLMHDAVSEPGEPSLHITTGLITKTWADFVLEAISETALTSRTLRKALPPGFHRDDFDRSILKSTLQTVLKEVGENADTDAILDLFIDNFIRGRQADLSGVLNHPQITPEDRFRRRTLVQLRLAHADENHLALVAPGGDILIDRTAESGLDALMAHEIIGMASFSKMEESEAVSILERLLAFGIVERV